MPKLPPKKINPDRESDVSSDVRAMLSREDVSHWRNTIGFDHRIKVTYGLAVGSCDLIAIVPTSLRCPHCDSLLPPIGRFVGIETKHPVRGVTSEEQHRWIGIVNTAHGVAGVANSLLDADVIVATARSQW